ncbi:MAG: sulfatase [Akkermansiaceae bacterium]|jgi:arylsulfatase A-like enzyme|nr:sulfatase [Akkermansiaceae bacterium]
MMTDDRRSGAPSAGAPPLKVAAGVAAFLVLQYALALWKLGQSSGGMMNKFSALAREQYLGFLVMQNLWMLAAYVLLGIGAFLLARPVVDGWTRRSPRRGHAMVMLRGFTVAAVLHGFFTLRLAQTRPYFLNEAEFGHWYYKMIEFPDPVRPAALFVLFTLLPLLYLGYVIAWHARRHGRKGWWVAAGVPALAASAFAIHENRGATMAAASGGGRAPNVIIIGSDSLRGDRLGYAGHRPQRNDGPAAAGVSPAIDALAARSVRFERCYTSIASTLESGVQLMASQYPHTHGIRQMYPDRATVEAAKQRVVPLPALLRGRGYDTAAIGDWCAGYYEIMPMGFEHVAVSSFDNFRIYMSQAVVMAHFVVPLYFDNPLGYILFPQIESFAQFVTPGVVTERVERRLEQVARDKQPFFWHVFYSCNHLPYRSKEPYAGMFADPDYSGPNKNGVDFDIDSFIGGTDLESKWKALPEKEIQQIRALYDGCTRQFDDCVAGILAALERNGLSDDTIVIITADHGDDLYEPGVTLGHGLTFNGGLHANHVPLVMHVPGAAPQAIPETVRLIDVIPTLADLMDVEPSPTWEGRSFAPWIRGVEAPRHRAFYGETGFPFIQFKVAGIERPPLPPMDELTRIDEQYNYQFVLKDEYAARLVEAKQRCLRSRDWKLVCTPTAQGGRHFGLFHLASDPHGEKDVAAARPEVLAPLRAALERWMDERIETPLEEIFPGGEP